MSMAFQVGQLVSSKQGRDIRKYYLILSFCDEKFVLVVDGLTRTVQRPKRKNISHLTYHAKVDQVLAEKLSLGVAVSDIEIRESLKRLTDMV